MTREGARYLSSKLQHEVDELNADLAASPTTPITLEHRTKVTWDWANSFAMAGGVVPIELPFFVAAVSVGDRAGEFSVLRRDREASCRELDQMIHELAVKDEHAGSIGTLDLPPRPPLAAGTLQTIQQTYTVGSARLQVGGGLLLGKVECADHGTPQFEDPGGENYVTVQTSHPAAVFTATIVQLRGLRGGVRVARPVVSFRLSGAELDPGDTVTITYGDTSHGGPGFRIQSYSNDGFTLPVYVDLDGSGNFLTLRHPAYEVVGGSVAAVHVFGPAVVAVGEPLDLLVRSEDAHRNKATGPIPEYQLSIGGRPVGRVGAGTTAVGRVSVAPLAERGVVRVDIVSSDHDINAKSDPIWVVAAPTERIFWGDLHGHCGFAEGQGSPDGYFAFGRDEARLDFLSLSEHDVFIDEAKWQYLKGCVKENTEEGAFVPLLGYEWTAPPALGGHHNVFFRGGQGDVVGVQQAPDLPQLLDDLAGRRSAGDTLVVPHVHQAGDWRRTSPELVTAVEVTSQHGSFEWFGRRYLDSGVRVGFVGGSDNHQGHPGYSNAGPSICESKNGLTAVLASSLNSDEIFSAIRNRSVYATSGERMLLDFEVDGAQMGAAVPAGGPHTIRYAVSGTGPLHRVDVLRSGRCVLRRRYGGPLAGASLLRVAFQSPSAVDGHDNPRGYRIWRGWLDFGRDVIRDIDSSPLFNWYAEFASLAEGGRRRVEFEVRTRGHANSVLLGVDHLRPEDVVTLHIEPSVEVGDSRYLRGRDEIDAADVLISGWELANGVAHRDIAAGAFVDRVSIDVVDPDGPWDEELTFVDRQKSTRGDYYYLRVEQIDGALGWSSPVWVGP